MNGSMAGPAERVRGRIMIVPTYANGVFIFLAINLRPLEVIDGPKAPIRTST